MKTKPALYFYNQSMAVNLRRLFVNLQMGSGEQTVLSLDVAKAFDGVE